MHPAACASTGAQRCKRQGPHGLCPSAPPASSAMSNRSPIIQHILSPNSDRTHAHFMFEALTVHKPFRPQQDWTAASPGGRLCQEGVRVPGGRDMSSVQLLHAQQGGHCHDSITHRTTPTWGVVRQKQDDCQHTPPGLYGRSVTCSLCIVATG